MEEIGIAGLGIFMILIIVAICMIPLIFYLITLQNTLKEISPENQLLPPGQVWLMLIPLFGLVWNFIIVNRIADSLRKEFDKRGIHYPEPRPGVGIGIAQAVLNCCSLIPFLGGLAGLAGLICWIIYWVKIAGCKTLLVNNRGFSTTSAF